MVVVEALRELNKESQCWHLERVCDEVTCRGHVVDGLTPSQAECMIRCEVGDGMGQGFFVCVFVRDTGTQLSEAERKKKEKEYIEMRKEPEFPITPTSQKVIVEKTDKEITNQKRGKVNQEKKTRKEKKPVKDTSTPINYAVRARQEHPGRHSKKIPLGKTYL